MTRKGETESVSSVVRQPMRPKLGDSDGEVLFLPAEKLGNSRKKEEKVSVASCVSRCVPSRAILTAVLCLPAEKRERVSSIVREPIH
jgi:hypothetical protein